MFSKIRQKPILNRPRYTFILIVYKNLNDSRLKWKFSWIHAKHAKQITQTRIKATRCETLRTDTTNNSKKHLNLTYCINITLMVHKKDLFWYITNYIINEVLKWALQTTHLSQKWAATIFFTSEPILLIFHENDLFWYVATHILCVI